MTTEQQEPGNGPTEALEQLTRLTTSSVEMWSAWTRTWQSLLSDIGVFVGGRGQRLMKDAIVAWLAER